MSFRTTVDNNTWWWCQVSLCTRDISSLVPKSKEDKNDILYSHLLGVLVFCKRVLLVLLMIA